MPRGAYDTTIGEELRRHRGGSSSQRLSGSEDRDAAVRRMNIRRGKRTGESGSNSTAYTPGDKTSSRSKSGREGHENTPGPSRNRPNTPRDPGLPGEGPLLEDKPINPNDPTGGIPWGLPNYTPPGGTEPIMPRPGEPGGGGPMEPVGPTPPGVPDAVPINVPVGLLPLLAAAGLSSTGGRNAMRAYPTPDEVSQAIVAPQRSVGGVPAIRGDDIVDAEWEPYRDPMGLPAPAAQQPPPDPRLMAAQEQLRLPPPVNAPVPPSPKQLPPPPTDEGRIQIDLGDEKKDRAKEGEKGRRQKTSGAAKEKFKKRVRLPKKLIPN